MPKEKRIQMIGEFYDVIDSLKDRNEVRFFFKSLLTADEIATLMRRIEIAVLLEGGYNYRQIYDILKVGSDKVSRVQKSLDQDDSGYKIIVKRLIENRKRRLKRIKKVEKEATDVSPIGAIKKYPSVRILPDLLDAVIEKLEDDKDLEKEALLFTPSHAPFGNKREKN
ncbi:MAG: YerC/YecD family TrpR-related protein [Candidatus Staskawiczbacteria bacterium]|nr:YerC/YecD family TrpR-related protein [Candidatus Staskawiczbacteria bacterium]